MITSLLTLIIVALGCYILSQDSVTITRKKALERENEYLQSKLNDFHRVKANAEIKEREAELLWKERELQKELAWKYTKDKDIVALKEMVADQKAENQKLQARVEMYEELVDINGDIVDVKELVNKLIEKLPDVNINTISVHGSNK